MRVTYLAFTLKHIDIHAVNLFEKVKLDLWSIRSLVVTAVMNALNLIRYPTLSFYANGLNDWLVVGSFIYKLFNAFSIHIFNIH